MACPPLPREDLEEIFAQTRDLWIQARGQSIFITGGTGFFGIWLLESFVHANATLNLGMRAVVLTRDPAAFSRKSPRLTARSDLVFYQGSLSDFSFPAGRFDHLIHLAADTAVWTKNETSHESVQSVVAGTSHLLDFAEAAGIKSFLLVSSGAVYGPQPFQLSNIPEDYEGFLDPALPASVWGKGKRVAEQMCLTHASQHGYALKIARCFTFVGPHLPLDVRYAIGNFIGDSLACRPIAIKGDGTAIRSYLYMSDLAIWLWTILFRGAAGRAFNVGSPAGVTISEVAHEVEAILGNSKGVTRGVFPLAGATSARYVPDVGRAARELGLECRVPLALAIRRTAAWWGWKCPSSAAKA